MTRNGAKFRRVLRSTWFVPRDAFVLRTFGVRPTLFTNSVLYEFDVDRCCPFDPADASFLYALVQRFDLTRSGTERNENLPSRGERFSRLLRGN